MVYAEASRPVLRLEVYANGALVAAANGQENVLTLAQPWTPLTPGRHALVARAFFSTDDFADSEVVFVDAADLSGAPVSVNVDDLPRGEGVTEIRLGDLAAAAGTTPTEIARLNPGLPPAPEAVIPPGTPLNLPRRSIPPPPASARPPIPPPSPGGPGSPPFGPGAPNFNGETHSCSQISMRWSDAPDETAYSLYRIAPGESAMARIARLPANTTTYTDSPVTRVGTYRYFLAPARPGGEGITSMLAVEIGPECSPAGTGATTSLNLLLLSLTTEQAYDGVYCYVSFNGSRYERLPAEPGLLRPTSGSLYYELPLQLPSRGIYGITVPSDGLVRLNGECWGRRGAQSLSIGRFSGSHSRTEWDGRDLVNSLLTFEPRQLASADSLPPAAGGASFVRYRLQPVGSRFDLSQIEAATSLRWISLNFPVILTPLGIGDIVVPPPTNLRVRNVAGCDFFPSTDPNVGSSVCTGPLEPMLMWNWSGNAFYAEADVTGWVLNVQVMDYQFGGTTWQPAVGRVVERPAGSASAGRSIPMPVLPSNYACGVDVRITLMTLTDRGNSLPSEPLIIRQPRCPQAGLVQITVKSIRVGPSASTGQVLDDGDICIACADRRMEVFGDIFIGLQAAPTFSERPWHGAGTTLFGACPANTACMTEGSYIWLRSPQIAPWLFEMETSVRSLGNGGAINIVVALQDYDTQNGSDEYCLASASLPARTDAEWTRFNEVLRLTGGSNEASCQVEVVVRGIPNFGAP